MAWTHKNVMSEMLPGGIRDRQTVSEVLTVVVAPTKTSDKVCETLCNMETPANTEENAESLPPPDYSKQFGRW